MKLRIELLAGAPFSETNLYSNLLLASFAKKIVSGAA